MTPRFRRAIVLVALTVMLVAVVGDNWFIFDSRPFPVASGSGRSRRAGLCGGGRTSAGGRRTAGGRWRGQTRWQARLSGGGRSSAGRRGSGFARRAGAGGRGLGWFGKGGLGRRR